MQQPFDYKKTAIVGFGFLGISLVWPVFNAFVPLFLQAGNPDFEHQLLEAGRELPTVVGFGLSPTLAFFVMTWDNILNVFIQPWAGAKSDRTWNRFGRRKPWIMVGIPIAIVGFTLVPLANTVLAIMVFILITNFGMAIFRSPTVAWLGDLFPAEQRSKANGIINLMGGIGAGVALFGGGYLIDSYGRSSPFIAAALLMVLAGVVVLLLVKEPEKINIQEEDTGGSVLDNLRAVWQTHDRSGFYVLLSILFWFMGYEALQTGLSSFAVFSLGLSAGRASMFVTFFALSFILFAVPSGLIGTRFGRRNTIIVGVVGMAFFMALGFLIVREPIGFGIILVLSGIFWALININSLPLVYDYGDESQIGAYTGLYYFASQSAAILGPVSSGFIVDMLGNQYRWLWVFSLVFLLFAWASMSRVKPAPAAVYAPDPA